MTQDMPRPRSPFLLKEKTRHGRTVWYVRRGDGPRVRVLGEFGTDEFTASYEAALRGEAAAPQAKVRTGSLRWLWDRYRESSDWADLASGTRRARENIMVHVLKKSGDAAYGDIDSGDIEAGKDDRRDTPAQARNFLDCMKGMFRWAKKATHIKIDPTADVKNPKKRKGPGFAAWTEDDVAAYQRKWPVGTKERVWLDVLLYTGFRRGDAARLGKQNYRDILDPETGKLIRCVSLRTEKSKYRIEVTIPILPILRTTLDAGPTGEMTFICGENERPLVKESFGNMFSAAARTAGIEKSAHGVRKIAATTCANNGASEKQLDSIFGWEGGQTSAIYTKEANRVRLARGAVHLLGRTAQKRAIPAPIKKVRG